MGKLKIIHKNLIFTVILVQAIFFIGLVISFLTFKLLPGNPAKAALTAAGIYDPSQELIAQMERQLGLDSPIFVQFLNYVGRLFSFNWGRSFRVIRDMSVFNLIKQRLPETVVMLFLPIIIGVLCGILLGIVSSRYRNKWQDILIQIFSYFILAIPVFFIGWYFQFYFGFKLDIIEPTGVGFVPRFILTTVIVAVTTLQIRSYLVKEQNKGSIIPFTLMIAKLFGIIFAFYILIDSTFGIPGIGKLLIDAILLRDYFVILTILYIIVLTYVFLILMSNIHFILYQHLASDNFKQSISQFSKPKTQSRPQSENNLKDYLLVRLKSPIFIIGMVLVLIITIIAIFPQILTPYSYDYLMQPHPGSWNPPSPDHPLGQTVLGGDVLGRTIFGIRDSLVFGLETITIGIIGGIGFGVIAGRFKPWGYRIVMTFMILFYIFPPILFIILGTAIVDPFYFVVMFSVGLTLVPNFMLVTASSIPGKLDRKTFYNICKSLITYVPLNLAIAILLYSSVGFLGLIQEPIISLGNDMNLARENPYEAPWAYLWPGLILSIIVFSFLILHLGLKGLGSIKRSNRNVVLGDVKIS